MSCREVKDYLGELTDITVYEEELILNLCRSALKEIEAKLRSDVDRSDYRIVAASAALAHYKLVLKTSNSDEFEMTSFKAGDVTIQQSTKEREKLLENVESFYEKKLIELIPLCRDDNFAFRQIKVMKDDFKHNVR